MGGGASLVRSVQLVLGMVAVALGAVAALHVTELGPWIGVLGTVSGAVIAHGAAARYDFLQLEYLRTAEQLRRLVADYRRRRAVDVASADAVVTTCERVISIQNEGWMAELVKERDADAEPPVPRPGHGLPQVEA